MSRLPPDKQTDSSKSSHEKTVEEIASDSIRGVDEPMEEEHPETPALLVFATYPVLLVVGLLLAMAVLWWWRSS